MNPIWNFLAGLIAPVTDLIDKMHTSDAEKLAVKVEMMRINQSFVARVMDYEDKLLNAKADIIKAEAAGASWMQRSWRPITMLTFLVLVVCDSFGWLAFRLAEQAWNLLQLGLGGYVIGRSVEKVAPAVIDSINKVQANNNSNRNNTPTSYLED